MCINAIITYESHPCILREIRKFHDTVDSIVILVVYRGPNNRGVEVRVVPRSDFHLFGNLSTDKNCIDDEIRFVRDEMWTYLNGDLKSMVEGE